MKKVAILGGTFNPIHQGHLQIAQTALHQHHLDRVVWVTTRYPPHKAATGLADFSHRLEMVKLAIAPYPAYVLSDVERRQSGISFAIDTLNTLQTLYPNCEWYWILGLDAFQSLPRWQGRRELADRCCWLVAPRPPQTASLDSNLHRCEQVVQQMQSQSILLCWHLLQMPSISVSSSQVRQYCRDQRSLRGLVSPAVQSYLVRHRLY